MNTNSKLNDMGADLIENQGNIIDDLTQERDMIAIRLAHVKDLIYALGLDYNKLSDKGKGHYDSIVKSVSEYGERNG
jgi:hypothetical protein